MIKLSKVILHFSEQIFAIVYYIVSFPEKYGKFYIVFVMWKFNRIPFIPYLEVPDI